MTADGLNPTCRHRTLSNTKSQAALGELWLFAPQFLIKRWLIACVNVEKRMENSQLPSDAERGACAAPLSCECATALKFVCDIAISACSVSHLQLWCGRPTVGAPEYRAFEFEDSGLGS